MKTGTKIFLIIVAIVCILSGSAIFTNVLAKNGWDFSTVNYETKEHSVRLAKSFVMKWKR